MSTRPDDIKLPPMSASRPPARPRASQIGFLSPQFLEAALTVLIYIGIALLVALSVLGTFYGVQGTEATLTPPWQMVIDAAANLSALAAAVVLQLVLTVVQYGARVKATRDRRWWLIYLVALGVSVYYNIQAYYGPLSALTIPPVFALLTIAAGDILPEIAAVKRG